MKAKERKESGGREENWRTLKVDSEGEMTVETPQPRSIFKWRILSRSGISRSRCCGNSKMFETIQRSLTCLELLKLGGAGLKSKGGLEPGAQIP